MKGINLSMKESLKYETIKELVDHGGNKKRAALKLGISLRQVNRLIKIYRTKGKAGFVHGNSGRLPANSLSQEFRNKIIILYMNEYQGFNFRHFTEKLLEWENISVSYGTVYYLLTSNGIYPPREHKITKKNRAKAEKSVSKINQEDPQTEETPSNQIAIEDAHPRRPRAKYFGEEVQMDASIHEWFGTSKSALHLAIDNASGNVLGGFLAEQETLHGYYNVFAQILTNYGIPAKFMTDNRTVFNYESKSRPKDSDDVLTQFGYACRTLGVTIETSSVSQRKGQVERANETFQDRFISELKKKGITDIDSANKYLIEVFIPDFNRLFGVPASKLESVMENSPTEEKINLTLAVLSTRKFDNGSAIKYQNQYYQAYDENDQLVCFKSKTECMVIKAMDGTLFVSVGDKVYALKVLLKNRRTSKNFDIQEKAEKPKQIYIPPMSHPWRLSSFQNHKEHAHQYHKYA